VEVFRSATSEEGRAVQKDIPAKGNSILGTEVFTRVTARDSILLVLQSLRSVSENAILLKIHPTGG